MLNMTTNIAAALDARPPGGTYGLPNTGSVSVQSASEVASGQSNLLGQAAREAWAKDLATINTDITTAQETLQASLAAKEGLEAMAEKLAELHGVIDRAHDATLTIPELEYLHEKYEGLKEEMYDLYAGPAGRGLQLLRGIEELVSLDFSGMAGEDLNGEGVSASKAITDAIVEATKAGAAAAANAEAKLAGLNEDLAKLRQRLDDVADAEMAPGSAGSATVAARSAREGVVERFTKGLATKTGVDPVRAAALLNDEVR
ncbi:MAG: hypothetical protein ACYS8X_13150 [Planctomycetota bacterium]|jgi:hypothetical protein